MEPKIRTGALRQDIRYIKPGIHGPYAMLFDPVAEHYYKLSPGAGAIISKLDRDYPLEEFLAKLARLGIEATKEEVMTVLNFLAGSALLVPEFGRYEAQLSHFRKLRNGSWFMKFASAYVFFRLPPIHPRNFWIAIGPYVRFLTEKWFLRCLIIPAFLGYLTILRDFGAVRDAFVNSLSWAGLVKYFFAIVFLKVVHESGHSLAATRFGCPVRAMGVSFIFFYPRIFTDTTDSWKLPRSQRLLIDSAGLLGELLCGGLAALIWGWLPPGPEKSTMFYIFAVSTMSTLLVNGNPFIRFDGYYILCDVLNVENLMQRSSEFVRNFWRCYFFRLGKAPEEERPWLMSSFGVSAFIYRFFLYTSIILVIYNNFIHIKILAAFMLFMEVYTLVILPLYHETKTMKALSRKAGGRASWFAMAAALIVILGVLFLPLSRDLRLPGEIRAQATRIVTAPEPGFLKSSWPKGAVEVKKDDTIAELESMLTDFQQERLESMIREDTVLADLQQSDRASFGDSLLTLQKLSSTKEARDEMIRRKALRQVKAERSGLFVPRLRELTPGAWIPGGTALGEIIAGDTVVRCFANDREIEFIREGETVSVLLPDAPSPLAGKVLSVDPIPVRLDNSPLLQLYGGEIPVYLDEKNPGSFLSVQSLYRVTVSLKDPGKGAWNGRTVRVRIPRKEALAAALWQMAVTAFRREI